MVGISHNKVAHHSHNNMTHIPDLSFVQTQFGWVCARKPLDAVEGNIVVGVKIC